MNKFSMMDRVKVLESHFFAARAATAFLLSECKVGRTKVGTGFTEKNIRDSYEDLEKTYLVMLFATFEWFVRDYWFFIRRRTNPQIKQLLDVVSSRLRIRYEVLSKVHGVRKYRNCILHGSIAPPVTLAEARSYLCRYLYSLPNEIDIPSRPI